MKIILNFVCLVLSVEALFDDLTEKKYWFITHLVNPEIRGYYWIKIDYNLKDLDIVISNQFRVLRDSLVAQGKLNKPYTDTEDYKNIIKSNLLYWKDGNWVKREEME